MAQRWSSVLLCSQNDICVQKMLFFQRTGTEMLKYLYRAYITNPTKVLLHKALLALLGIFFFTKRKKAHGLLLLYTNHGKTSLPCYDTYTKKMFNGMVCQEEG